MIGLGLLQGPAEGSPVVAGVVVGQQEDSRRRIRRRRNRGEGEGALDGGREAAPPLLASLCFLSFELLVLLLRFFFVKPARVSLGIFVALDDHEVVGAVPAFGPVAEEVGEVLGGLRVCF